MQHSLLGSMVNIWLKNGFYFLFCFLQASWRKEVIDYFAWLKSQGSQLTLLDDDLIAKKREEIM